jgi:hypothetical protein
MDSDMTVREVSLGDDGIDYVHSLLSTGGPLAQVLRGIDLNAGRAVTLWRTGIQSRQRSCKKAVTCQPAMLSRYSAQV